MNDEDGLESQAALEASQAAVSSSHLARAPLSESLALIHQNLTGQNEEKEEKGRLDGMDHLLSCMGSPGRYQVLIFLALASCMFPVVFNDLCSIFYTVHPVSSTCWMPVMPDNLSVILTNSSTYTLARTNSTSHYILNITYIDSQSCSTLQGLQEDSADADLCWNSMQHHFEEPTAWSIISQWSLVCQRYWQVSFATTVYFLGVMVGSMTFGHLADQYGRYRCIMACYLGYLPLGIALSFVQHYWLFLLLRFFIGFFIQGVQSVCFVLVMEYCSPKFRDIVGGLEGLIGGLGVGVLSGIAYWWQDWRYIQLCLTIPTFLALIKACFLRESLRWQMVHGKVKEARQTIVLIFGWNNLVLDSSKLDDQLKDMSDALLAEQQLEANYTWIDCFRTPRMRKFTLAHSFIWFTVLFVYYGISFSINGLSGNMYLNLIAGSAAEIPVYILTVFFMQRFGRKKPLLVHFSSCGILCLVVAVMSLDLGISSADGILRLEDIRTMMVFFARFCLAGTYAIVFVYGSELFPTVLRNTAFGICICCHTFGGVLAPQLLLLGKLINEAVPFIVFGLCCLTSCLLLLTLPETLNGKMPDTIDQVEGTSRQ